MPVSAQYTDGITAGIEERKFDFFQYQSDAFLTHYHKRSNVESTVTMVNSKFGDSLPSKTDMAQRNEVLCKIICHNICCLICAIYEHGIDPALC